MATKDNLKERKLERMRLGQAVCEIVPLNSDPEIKFALVPLSEAEYRTAFAAAARYDVPDNMTGLQLRDRVLSSELLVQSLREHNDLMTKAFDSVEEMISPEALTSDDVDQLIDEFNEMTEKSNPSLDGIPPEEFEALKKFLPRLDWNDLSGRSWYAAKRFLGALILDGLLRDNFRGSISTNQLTTRKG